MKKTFSLILLLISLQLKSQWINTNGPFGGEVKQMISDNSKIVTIISGSVYISQDFGNTWNKTKGILNIFPDDIALKGNNIIVTSSDKVFISNNLGDTWKEITSNLANVFITCITVDGNDIYLGTSSKGIYKSSNEGVSWSLKNNGHSTDNVQSIIKDNGKLFSCTWTEIFSSTDSGENWVLVKKNFTGGILMSCLTISGNNFYVGTSGNGVFRSLDAGASWTAIPNGYIGGTVYNLYVVNNELLACSSGGFSKFNSTSKSWESYNKGINAALVECFISINNSYLVGTSGGGIFSSTDKGSTWKLSSNSLSLHWINTIVSTDSVLFCGTNYGLAFINKNKSWNNSTKGLYNYGSFRDALKFGKDIFGATSKGIVKSQDNGNSWSSYNAGMGEMSLAGIEQSNTKLFAATSSSGVFVSIDSGLFWNRFNTSIPAYDLTTIYSYRDKIYACSWGGYCFNTSSVKDSWVNQSNGLPNSSIRSLTAIDTVLIAGTDGNGIYVSSIKGGGWKKQSNSPDAKVYVLKTINNQILVGTDIGIFYSKDTMKTWTNVGTGLPSNIAIVSLDYNQDKIFIGTKANGVWERPLNEIITNQIDLTRQEEIQLFPNPIRKGETLQISLNSQDLFKVAHIYNSIGELLNSYSISGEIERLSLPIKLASGNYVIKLSNKINSISQQFQVVE